MEHALARMWDHVGQDRRITLETYRAIGGVQSALAQPADDIFGGLTRAEQALTRRMR